MQCAPTDGSRGHLGPPPKTLSDLFATPKRSIVVTSFFLQILMITERRLRMITERSVPTSHWRCQVDYFWLFRFKISKFSSESQNLPKMGCLHIQDRFKTNLHALKKHVSSSYVKNINFCHIFVALGDTLVGGNSGIFHYFSKVNLGSYRKIVA